MEIKDLSIVVPVWGFTRAGGSRVLAEWINHWTKNGIRADVVCFYRSCEPYFPIKSTVIYINEQGEKVERIDPDKANKNPVSRFVDLISIHRGMLSYLNQVSSIYNVVIANYALSAFSVSYSKIRNKYYYIQAYEAWNQRTGIFGGLLNWLIKRTYKLNLIRVVNADIYKNYKEIKSKYVVPPGLDLDIYFAKTTEWNGRGKITVGCIGRTEEWKGSEDVAIAVDILQKKGLPIQFDVAFNPVHHSDFRLVKPDGDKNLAAYYRGLDVLVAPAKEQLGAIHYPVLEAMASRTPVITTGYYPASNNNSYIVPVSSPERIASTIEEIYNDYSEAMRKANIALKDIQAFDWNVVSKKMLDIIMTTSEL